LNTNTIFHDYQIAPEQKHSFLDKEGSRLQEEALTLAKEGITALQAIDEANADIKNGNLDIARTYVKDMIGVASKIGSSGTMKRLYASHPNMARIIKYASETHVVTPQI
jgi:hypothetical protein